MKLEPPSVYVELAQAREQRDRVAEANVKLARQVRLLEDADAVTLREVLTLHADNVRQANRIQQMEAGLVHLMTHGTRWPFIPAGQVKAAVRQILRGES